MRRREFLGTGIAAGIGASLWMTTSSRALAAEGEFGVMRTEDEWREMLSDLEYEVMREEGTEPAFSSPLDKTFDPGTYHCRGCDLALYPSATKFDSGTGWPSFWREIDGAIGTQDDRSFLFLVLTECHCSRCGSHLGHIFEDGPEPTGLRHCINGVSLVFKRG